MSPPLLSGYRAVAFTLLLLLGCSWGLSTEATKDSHHRSQLKKRRHLEVKTTVVHTDDGGNDGDEDEEEVVEGEEVPADEETSSEPESEDDDGEAPEEKTDDLAFKYPKHDPHAPERAKLKKAVEEAKQKLADNAAEQARINAEIEHLKDKAKSSKEIDSTAELVGKETGTTAMGAMYAKMWKELRMFETPKYIKQVESKLKPLKEEEKDLVTKLATAEANLKAAESRWKDEDTKKEPMASEAEADEEPKLEVTEGSSDEEPKLEAASDEEPKLEAESIEMKEPKLDKATPPPEVKKQQAKTNVWGFSKPRRESIYLMSFVYLCFGVCCAYLYDRFRYDKWLSPVPRPDIFPSYERFSFNLFDCFSDSKLCLVGCCCPFLRWADTIDRQGLLAYWKAFIAMFGLLLLHVYTYGLSDIAVVILGVTYRQKLRSRFQIENGTKKSVFYDTLTWCCCQPCAIIQEAREDTVQRGGSGV